MTTKTSTRQLNADFLLIFLAASRAKLKRYLRPGPHPLTFFTNTLKTTKERKKKQELKYNGSTPSIITEKRERKYTALKVPGQCPLGLLVKVG
jgi:hypothetical protein